MSLKYDNYLKEHKDNVLKAYDWLKKNDLIRGNFRSRLEIHDCSKYSKDEYEAYDDYFYKGAKLPQIEIEEAWLHHIHNNPHHWQYWILYNGDGTLNALEMPYNYAIEMICDWWSFSFKKNNLGEILDWYEKNKNKMILHEKTRELVEEILEEMRGILR